MQKTKSKGKKRERKTTRTNSYLIEFRFWGEEKKKIKGMIRRVNQKFKIRPPRRPVPHASIVGSFTTRNEEKLISDFNRICSRYSVMEIKVDGFGFFNENKVIFINILPCVELIEFRWELISNLKSYCKLRAYDKKKEWIPHATLAMKLTNKKFGKVKNYVENSIRKPSFKDHVVRVTLLKDITKGRKKEGIILREYDFLMKKSLTRGEAKNRVTNKRTLELFNKYLKGELNHVPSATKGEMGVLTRIKRIFHLFQRKDPNKDKNSMLLFFNFKNKVPYEEYRHMVVSVANLVQQYSFCKKFGFLRLYSDDKKFMEAMVIYCFNLKFSENKLQEKMAKIIPILISGFESIGIDAEINPKEAKRISLSYEEYIHEMVTSTFQVE